MGRDIHYCPECAEEIFDGMELCLMCESKAARGAGEDSRSSSGYANESKNALVEWMNKTGMADITLGGILTFEAGYAAGRAHSGDSHTCVAISHGGNDNEKQT